MFDRNTEMDMTEGPLFKKLVDYAIPIMLTGILQKYKLMYPVKNFPCISV